MVRWGVSNFDTDDMKELWNTTNGKNCMTNQVLYHLGSRGIDYDLLPWQRDHNLSIMAYSPLSQLMIKSLFLAVEFLEKYC